MNVILFFTYGVSIKTWESTGILSREMELYNQLAKKHNIKFTFVTYGDNDDYLFENYFENLTILPIYALSKYSNSKVIRILKTLIIPFKLRKLIGNEKINYSNQVSGCVIATSQGYPHKYKTGFPIKIGKIDSSDCQIFDSGTCLNKNGELLTDGGRVLSIVCQDKNFDMVFEKAYKNLKEINFDGIYFRNDIGHQVRKNFSSEN